MPKYDRGKPGVLAGEWGLSAKKANDADRKAPREKGRARKAALQKGDYEVGYGKPPKSTRFKPGQSANPGGRPEIDRRPGVVIDETLNKTVSVRIDGRSRKMTLFQAMFIKMAGEAMAGSVQARRDLLKYALEFGYSPPPLQFRTLLEAWAGQDMPETSIHWLLQADLVCEALRKAGLLQVLDDGSIRIRVDEFERLLGPGPTAAERKAIAADLIARDMLI